MRGTTSPYYARRMAIRADRPSARSALLHLHSRSRLQTLTPNSHHGWVTRILWAAIILCEDRYSMHTRNCRPLASWIAPTETTWIPQTLSLLYVRH